MKGQTRMPITELGVVEPRLQPGRLPRKSMKQILIYKHFPESLACSRILTSGMCVGSVLPSCTEVAKVFIEII